MTLYFIYTYINTFHLTLAEGEHQATAGMGLIFLLVILMTRYVTEFLLIFILFS